MSIAKISLGASGAKPGGGGYNGNNNYSTMAKGTGPAMASVDAALTALRQLRSMWQAIKDSSAADLAGLGGAGGGGGGRAAGQPHRQRHHYHKIRPFPREHPAACDPGGRPPRPRRKQRSFSTGGLEADGGAAAGRHAAVSALRRRQRAL